MLNFVQKVACIEALRVISQFIFLSLCSIHMWSFISGILGLSLQLVFSLVTTKSIEME
jgi:hypothetical protein